MLGKSTKTTFGIVSHPVKKPSLIYLLFWATLFQIAWNWRQWNLIIQDHMLPGPDDQMRLHMVRNFLNGDGWFNLHVERMFPPEGFDMHWSRIVDVPIAAIVYGVRPFTGTIIAEKVAMIVWPTLLLLGSVALLIKVCEQIYPRINLFLPLILVVTCISFFSQFRFGRLDHHNLQILLLCILFWCVINRHRHWVNFLAGAVISLSIAIGLDNAIFIIPLMVYWGLEWGVGDDRQGNGLRWFASGIAVSALLFYGLTIDPANYWKSVCDSNSIVFLSAQILVSLFLFLLPLCGAILPGSGLPGLDIKRFVWRLGLGGLFSGIVLGILYLTFPECQAGPMSQLPLEVQERWLHRIMEAKSLAVILQEEPQHWLQTFAFHVLVIVAGGFMLIQFAYGRSMPAPKAFIVFYGMFVFSFLAGFFQFRLISIGILTAIPITVLAADRMMGWAGERYHHWWMLRVAQIAIILLFSSASWMFIGISIFPDKHSNIKANNGLAQNSSKNIFSVSSKDRCTGQGAHKTLAGLPSGIVISTLNGAPAILIFTDHTVVSGNYHRIPQAILDVSDFFETNNSTARILARKYDADYVSLCLLDRFLESSFSDRLIDRLRGNNPPPWLTPIHGKDDFLAIYRINKSMLFGAVPL